ncbi:MAG: hypothetical protein WAU32_00240 [Thermoanaerobaculia bacterium]
MRRQLARTNGKRLASPQSVNSAVKAICDIDELFRLVPSRGNRERSWTVGRAEIEAKGYDLKAVNPNAKSDEDTRTPEQLLDIIDEKGREVAEAIAALRSLLGADS